MQMQWIQIHRSAFHLLPVYSHPHHLKPDIMRIIFTMNSPVSSKPKAFLIISCLVSGSLLLLLLLLLVGFWSRGVEDLSCCSLDIFCTTIRLGTELNYDLTLATPKPVLRIRDVYPGSRILIFTHSGSRISDPGSRSPEPGSRIPDPKTATEERGEKKFVVKPFFVATNFTKLKIILFFKWWRKNLGQFFQRIIELFTQKLVTKL